jgi:NAD(P)-dependent dehydrogenase (short-subunit alcohol dehydrogenase family)
MKRVVLTGASGGIGLACLEAFLKRGCQVVAVDLDPAPVKGFVEARGWKDAVEVCQLRYPNGTKC